MNQFSPADVPDLDRSFNYNKKCDPLEIGFVSRECKAGNHPKCDGQWSGFGFQIVCICKCDHSKKGPTLERLSGLHSNESQPASSCKLTGVEPRV
ncbi:MAG: hypothetical protein WAM14_16215 [Candidatus Nitrosopolaris sp.]